ncbi:MAG: hypothetical protein QOE02_5247 [Rhodospirillaceae bacterium]|nr:hypothetical protein [Rhodospirillaceae bacterium]
MAVGALPELSAQRAVRLPELRAGSRSRICQAALELRGPIGFWIAESTGNDRPALLAAAPYRHNSSGSPTVYAPVRQSAVLR